MAVAMAMAMAMAMALAMAMAMALAMAMAMAMAMALAMAMAGSHVQEDVPEPLVTRRGGENYSARQSNRSWSQITSP